MIDRPSEFYQFVLGPGTLLTRSTENEEDLCAHDAPIRNLDRNYRPKRHETLLDMAIYYTKTQERSGYTINRKPFVVDFSAESIQKGVKECSTGRTFGRELHTVGDALARGDDDMLQMLFNTVGQHRAMNL